MSAPGPNGNKKAANADPRRRSLLDLAPLELDCMNTLWPIGEGTVREIRDQLAPRRPRAYTTIMTIMDRLARKGIVERRKSGRAYVYRPTLSVEDARSHALGQIVESFFGGSREIAAAYLRDGVSHELDARDARPAMAAAAAASASAGLGRTGVVAPASAPAPDGTNSTTAVERTSAARTQHSADDAAPIDATLL